MSSYAISCIFDDNYVHSLKWKPPEENSVDFRLELRFPPQYNNPSEPDLTRLPMFLLYVWEGGHNYSYYDTLLVEEEEWET